MCTSTAVEAGAVERRRHFDLAVDALLAQDRHLRSRAGGDVRRGDVVGRIEGEFRHAGPAHRNAARASRSSSAQSGLSRSLCIACVTDHQASNSSSQRHSASTSSFAHARGSIGAVIGSRDALRAVSQVMAVDQVGELRAILGGDLHHRAQFLVEQRAQNASSPQPSRLMLQAAVASERHLAQRRERAAVGTVVVGQQQAGRARVAGSVRRTRAGARGSSRSGTPTLSPASAVVAPAPGSSRPGAAGRRPGRSATARTPRRAPAAA